MRFFTPELYLRFNSRDDAVALAADAEWEAAIARYNAHLDSFRGKMPSQVVNLSEMCLHDADILLRQEQQEPFELAYARTGLRLRLGCLGMEYSRLLSGSMTKC